VFTGAAIAGLGLGLAMLAKGPVGVVLPIGIWGLWLIVTQGRRFLSGIPWAGCVLAFLIAALISAPWYFAIARQHPEFLKSFLFGENIARLTGSQFYHKPQPPYFYLPILVIGLIPWSAFLNTSIARLRRENNHDTPEIKDSRRTPEARRNHEAAFTTRSNLWFLWVWAIAVIGLFSISHVKLITYILPAFPALALLIAEVLSPREPQDATLSHPALSRPMIWATRITAALLLLIAIAVPIAFLKRHGMAEKMMPVNEIAPYVWALAAVTAITAALLLTVFSRRIARVLTSGAIAIFVVLLSAAGQVSRYEDASSLFIALKPHLKPDDKFVQFKSFDPTAIFYLNRPVQVFNVENRSGWAEQAFQTSPQFPQDTTLVQRLINEANASGRRVIVMCRWKHAHFPALKGLKPIAVINDYRLFSNQPAPQGFQHHYLSPKNRERELSPDCKALSPKC
jgi:4-amino-4-deoxy-L-arabinose transferase-like glycosyltransferase